MESFSFTVWKNPKSNLHEQTYYFDLDEKGDLVKLGDGSFGMVFRVRNQAESHFPGEYAAKIFYTNEFIKDRFRLELEFWDEIKRVATQKGIPSNELRCIVEPQGGTFRFHESEAYKNIFQKKYDDLKVSSHVIVMKCYDGTLKDILENRIQNGLNGYEVLKSMSVNDRIRWILPFISDIIDGLRSLYIVSGNAHLDLKPGNIFYKLDGDSFSVSIGDMGSLRPYHESAPNSEDSYRLDEEIKRKELLGTLHFRSPEQKDYFEICYGKVEKINGKIIVSVKDPKFSDSIVEKGDLLYFSKSSEKTPFIIESIEPKEDSSDEKCVVISIKENKLSKKVKEDEKTQIVIHKKQHLRTDLFGIGAIAYDLITCGKSPERFYERLRIWDNKKNSIAKIMERYHRLSNDNFSEPQSKHVFESLIFGSRYANERIVQFILKCMLYHSPGTFFEEFQNFQTKREIEDNPLSEGIGISNLNPEEYVLNVIKKDFKDKFKDELTQESRAGNPIILKQKPAYPSNTDGVINLSMILRKLQNLDPEKESAKRIILAYHYFDLLFEYTAKVFEDNSSFYFSELNPENVTVNSLEDGNKKIGNPVYPAFPKVEDYFNAIRDYELHIKVKTEPNSYFIPQYLVHIHRPIELEEVNDPSYSQTDFQTACFKFHFNSKSFPYDEVKAGDWILIRKKDITKNELYRIFQVDQNNFIIYIKSFDAQNKLTENDRGDRGVVLKDPENEEKDPVVYFKDIDRGAYYLQILGVYIHQLFFAGFQKIETVSVPAFVDLVNIESARNSFKNFNCKDPKDILKLQNHKKKGKTVIGFDILTSLINLYARMIFLNLENSYYRPTSAEVSKIIPDIREALSDIRAKIERIFELDKHSLLFSSKFIESIEDDFLGVGRHRLSEPASVKIEAANKKFKECFPENFNFEEMLEKMISNEAVSRISVWSKILDFFEKIKFKLPVFNFKNDKFKRIGFISIAGLLLLLVGITWLSKSGSGPDCHRLNANKTSIEKNIHLKNNDLKKLLKDSARIVSLDNELTSQINELRDRENELEKEISAKEELARMNEDMGLRSNNLERDLEKLRTEKNDNSLKIKPIEDELRKFQVESQKNKDKTNQLKQALDSLERLGDATRDSIDVFCRSTDNN